MFMSPFMCVVSSMYKYWRNWPEMLEGWGMTFFFIQTFQYMMCLSPWQPKLTLENSLITRFSEEGEVPVIVQASNGRSMVQDSKTVIVYGKIKHPMKLYSIRDELVGDWAMWATTAASQIYISFSSLSLPRLSNSSKMFAMANQI